MKFAKGKRPRGSIREMIAHLTELTRDWDTGRRPTGEIRPISAEPLSFCALKFVRSFAEFSVSHVHKFFN